MFFRGFEVQDRRCQEGNGGEDAEVVADAHLNDIFGDGAGDQILRLLRLPNGDHGKYGGAATDTEHGDFIFQLPSHQGGYGDDNEKNAVAPLDFVSCDACDLGGNADEISVKAQAEGAEFQIGKKGGDDGHDGGVGFFCGARESARGLPQLMQNSESASFFFPQ